MDNLLYDLLVKILLTWLLILPLMYAAPLNDAINEVDKVFVKPSDLVVKEPSDLGPLKYHFIIDYPHPPVPGNQYYKPWNTVSSNHITVRNTENDLSRILKKKNILYLSRAEEDKTHLIQIKE